MTLDPYPCDFTDPIHLVLDRHQGVKTAQGAVLCLCGEMFDAPGYHRTHVANLIRVTLGLPEWKESGGT